MYANVWSNAAGQWRAARGATNANRNASASRLKQPGYAVPARPAGARLWETRPPREAGRPGTPAESREIPDTRRTGSTHPEDPAIFSSEELSRGCFLCRATRGCETKGRHRKLR